LRSNARAPFSPLGAPSDLIFPRRCGPRPLQPRGVACVSVPLDSSPSRQKFVPSIASSYSARSSEDEARHAVDRSVFTKCNCRATSPPLARRLLAHARHFLVAPVSAVSLLLSDRSNGFLLGRPHRSLDDAHRFDRRLASGRPPNSRLPLVCMLVTARVVRLCGVIDACAFAFRMESDRDGII